MTHQDPATSEPTTGEDRCGTDAFLHRLGILLADAKMPNGTSAAAAVHAAVSAELAVTGRPVTDLETLKDARLRQTCRRLSIALDSGGGTSITLPFDTIAVSSAPGTLTIGQQGYVLDVGRAGLHRLETVRRDAHGPNFDRLVALIARATEKLTCRRLGVPTPRHLVDIDSRHVMQFAPLVEAGGVILQRPSNDSGADRFCAALPWQIDNLAGSMIEEMRTLWLRRVEIGARVEEVRLAAEAGLRAEAGLEGRARVEAISTQYPDRESERPTLYIEYRAIDEALRPGTVLGYVPAFRELDGPLSPPDSMSTRFAVRERLEQVGATGWIDGLAEAVALAAPQGYAEVLATLAERYETAVVLPGQNGVLCAQLYWLDGRITASVSLPGSFEWNSDKLELNGAALPETVVQNLPGRSVSEVVELPFRTDIKILDANVLSGRTVLTTDFAEKLVNSEKRVILDTPALDRHLLLYGIKASDWHAS